MWLKEEPLERRKRPIDPLQDAEMNISVYPNVVIVVVGQGSYDELSKSRFSMLQFYHLLSSMRKMLLHILTYLAGCLPYHQRSLTRFFLPLIISRLDFIFEVFNDLIGFNKIKSKAWWSFWLHFAFPKGRRVLCNASHLEPLLSPLPYSLFWQHISGL